VWTTQEAAAFAEGAYEPLLEIAQDIGLPVCLFIPGHAELLARYLRKFPRLTLVIDHCGMGFPGIPPGRPEAEERRTIAPAYFAEVLKLAEFPNCALKWSHAQSRFATPTYPYEPLRPLLRRAITAFGADRLMWASDKTVMFGHRWGDLLYCLRDDPELSREEKEWILGRSARRILSWAASSAESVKKATKPLISDS
jgi:predicted TIM-barrel fold metal-dependent hydrolase